MPTQNANGVQSASAAAPQRVLDYLAANPNSTTAEIAEAIGIGRSTVGKHLTALERDNNVTRSRGEHQGGQRTPDRWTKTKTNRLRPGQLDALVLDAVRAADGPVGPVAVARAIDRSSGAVANCLERLTKVRTLKLVEDKPRRYEEAA